MNGSRAYTVGVEHSELFLAFGSYFRAITSLIPSINDFGTSRWWSPFNSLPNQPRRLLRCIWFSFFFPSPCISECSSYGLVNKVEHFLACRYKCVNGGKTFLDNHIYCYQVHKAKNFLLESLICLFFLSVDPPTPLTPDSLFIF